MSKDFDPNNQNYDVIDIDQEMKSSYMEYAMSVIISRALPDVRDGLKPVHRRILFAMHELANHWNRKHKKSARIVGDVIGKYHPHGDSAVYEAMVRLAQEWSTRYLLVDGQGNFGSVDGDSAAAMRYTEVRLAKIASEILADIQKRTVDFVPNYDDTLQEPSVLPTRVPTLLLNGTNGIAVGMATNIPPHNLNEVVNGVMHLIDNPEASVEELLEFIPGPDFPTHGIIQGMRGIINAYTTGRGIIKIRGKSDVETVGKRERIVITELPYQVNKAKFLEKVADLVRDKKIEGISDLRDESDRKGMRVVIELKKDVIAQIIINQLIKNTSFQSSFGINLMAIADNRPKLFNLKELLSHFIQHRREVITRRTIFDLEKAEAEIHLLLGLMRALDMIDEVIKLIRSSENSRVASERLVEELEFSTRQAEAILKMPLSKLTQLEKEKLQGDIDRLKELIAELQSILDSETKLFSVMKEELTEVTDNYGDERRTQIDMDTSEIDIEDLIPNEEVVVTITHAGYIKRTPLNLYKSQRRGGRGQSGQSTREDDFVKNVFQTSNHSNILIFTDRGQCYNLKVYQIPQAGRVAKGKPIVNLIQLIADEKVLSILPVPEWDPDNNVIIATQFGKIKRTKLKEFTNARTKGIRALTFLDDDRVVGVALSEGGKQILLSTAKGMAVRFLEEDVRPMGRTAMGVRSCRLAPGDEVVALCVVSEDDTVFTLADNGMGKKTLVGNYRLVKRGAKGVISMKMSSRKVRIVGAIKANMDSDAMLITDFGTIIRFSIDEISTINRNTKGVRVIRLKDGETLVGFTLVPKADDPFDDEEDGEATGNPEAVDSSQNEGTDSAAEEGSSEPESE